MLMQRLQGGNKEEDNRWAQTQAWQQQMMKMMGNRGYAGGTNMPNGYRPINYNQSAYSAFGR